MNLAAVSSKQEQAAAHALKATIEANPSVAAAIIGVLWEKVAQGGEIEGLSPAILEKLISSLPPVSNAEKAAKAAAESQALPTVCAAAHKAFIVRNGIKAIGDTQVAYTVTNALEFLKEAQALSIWFHEACPGTWQADQAIMPARLEIWANDKRFKASRPAEEIVTDGCVFDSNSKTRQGVKIFLKDQGLTMEEYAQLAIAHTARYLLDGESIFDGKWVRALGGVLSFFDDGLSEYRVRSDYVSRNVSASARTARHLGIKD